MPNNPFIFFEMDFDAELFKNYFGVDIDSPGIYAIPEDGVGGQEISDTQQLNNQQITNSNDNQEINTNDLNTQLTQGQTPPIELTPEEQQQFDKDVEPLKKVFLLNKLYELSYLLKNKFSVDSDLELILKFGPSMKYHTLKILTINILNQLKNYANMSESQQQQGVPYNGE